MDTSETYYTMCVKAFPEDAENGTAFKTQDQLQEMIWDNDWVVQQMRLYNESNALSNPPYDDKEYQRRIKYWAQFKSWEQLWLAFIMSERYQKIWRNDEWKPI